MQAGWKNMRVYISIVHTDSVDVYVCTQMKGFVLPGEQQRVVQHE